MKIGLSCGLLAFASLSLAQPSPLPSATDDFVLSGPIAYGMMGPETIAGNVASDVTWSDDGKYLMALRNDPGSSASIQSLLNSQKPPNDLGEQSIVIYKLGERKSVVVWHGKIGTQMVMDVQWFKGSDMAIAEIGEILPSTDPTRPTQSQEQAILIDARSGSAQPIFRVDQENGEPSLDISLSPTKPVGLLMLRTFVTEGKPGQDARGGSWRTQYRAIGSNGQVGAVVNVDSGASVTGWLPDGDSAIMLKFGRQPDGKVWRETQLLNVITGKFSPGAAAKPYEPQPVKQPIMAIDGSATMAISNKQRRGRSWWLVADGGDSQAMITSDSKDVILSPTLSGVVYLSQGQALVRQIIQMPKDMFLEALKAAQRAQIMSNTKQVGLALIMYASDMDDTLPSNQSDIGKLIDPYLKNPDLMNGFSYTFGGGLMSDIKSPADTVIGFSAGPGGRAVLYSDGHVKWQNDK